jgi:hypothetical protein
MQEETKYPFLFIGHGTGYYRKHIENYLCFENELKEEERKWVENQLPGPVSVFFNWEYTTLHFGSDDALPYYISTDFGNAKESDFERFESHYDKELQELLYDEEAWLKFHKALDECLKEIHKKFPIVYFRKGLDGEYGYDLDEWHEWSINNITGFFPYYNDYLTYVRENIDNYEKDEYDGSVKTSAPWILAGILDFVNFESDQLTDENRRELLGFISHTTAYDSYIGEYNIDHAPYILKCIKDSDPLEYLDKNFTPANCLKIISRNSDFFPRSDSFYEYLKLKIKSIEDVNNNLFTGLGELINLFSPEEKNEIINNIPEDLLLHFFCSSKTNSLLLLEFSDNIIEFIKTLIPKSKDISAQKITHLANNISNIKRENTSGKTDVKIAENEKSHLMLGFEIAKLGLDLPGVDENLILSISKIFENKKMYEKGLYFYEKAISLNIITPQICTGLLYNLLQIDDQEKVDKYFELFSKNEKIMNDPYPLSNIIYHLNRKGEEGDENAIKMAVKLTKNYWEKNCSSMIATLYVNLTDTFLVAEKEDAMFFSMLDSAIKTLEENPKYFSSYEGTLWENAACYYGMINDKENVLKYLHKARDTKHKNFAALKENKFFNSWQNDEDFISLFADFK